MPKDKVVKTKSIEEIKDLISNSGIGLDSKYILRLADEEMKNIKNKNALDSKSSVYKAFTLFEFDNGILLLNAISELYRVFALEFSKNLQIEFDCNTPSEKSMAEATTLNFVRTLEVQRRINNALGSMKTRYDIQYLAVLSKELDRAQRHYLGSLQALRTLHSPSFNVNIKTNTAVVGQNQIVQANNNDKPI